MVKKKDKTDKPRVEFTTVPILDTGNALYLLMEGGTFEGEGVSGSFGMSIGSGGIIVYVKKDDVSRSFIVSTQDVVNAIVEKIKAGG